MPELTRNSSYTRRLRTLTGLAGVVALIGGVLLVSAIPVRTGVATIPAPAVGVIIGDRVQAVLPMTPAPLVDLTGHELPPTDGSREFSQVVERGDTLAEILVPHGVTQGEIEALFAAGQEGKALQRLRAGQVLAAHLDRDGRVLSLRHEADHLSAVVIERGASGFNSRREPVALERRTERASGVIDSTLFDAAEEAGLSDSLTMALADIFGYDIDFALDLRDGDRFTVLWETFWRDGEKLRDGEILAAEFINRGKSYRAVRYQVPGAKKPAYFSPDGKGLRKAFLLTPVEFTRISSYFSPGRRHPILNQIRAHKGIDYAAPTGTPVRATADGEVTFQGNRNGYGKTIELQHDGRHKTRYAHLSRIAVVSGAKVQQGQVIGYVGMTGLATGPHLHYEFLDGDQHKNPLTVALAQNAPVIGSDKGMFKSRTAPLLAELSVYAKAPNVHLLAGGD